MAFSWIVCTALGVGLLVWNRSFVDLWVGAQYYAGPTVMLLIVVMATQFVFIGNDARIIDLTLHMRAKVATGLVSAGLSVLFAAVAMHFATDDIFAMCVGVIAGRSILTIAYPWIVGRLLGDPPWRQLRAIPRPLLTSALLFAVATWLGQHLTANTWVELVIWGGGTAIAVGLVAAFLGMSGKQRVALLARFRKIARGGRPDRSATRTEEQP
jgi:hypothetical protein